MLRPSGFLFALFVLPPAPVLADSIGPASEDVAFAARFVDIAREAGLIEPVIYGSTTQKDYILETVGSGAAFVDYDNDGWLDAFVLTGGRVGEEHPQASNRLYRNRRDGTFEDVSRQAGLWRNGWASSVTVGDYNNDGHTDLYVTYWGPNVLYRNNGDGTFSDVTRQAGLLETETRWGSGATFLDFDRDGLLDLFVATYMEFDLDQARAAGVKKCNWKGIKVNCGSDGLPKGSHSLFRNRGDGTFADVSEASGIAGVTTAYAMTAVAADLDSDGWPDIYVAGDDTPSLLYRNNQDGTFSEEGLERGAALSADGDEQAGMGIGVGDYDLDGDLDLFKTHFVDETNVLYRNDGPGHFEDVTIASGLSVETRFVGWGAGIQDLDNDGWPDLFYATGNVYPEIARQREDASHRTPRVIFRNQGGKLVELIEKAGPGVAARHDSRGCAFGDFDNDGDLDILVVNLNEPPSLLRNDLAGGGNWLNLQLVGTRSNRSALGARVVARYGGRQQAREVLGQSSYYSANDLRVHFGLGNAATVDLEVRWPHGTVQTFHKVRANQFVRIQEGGAVELRPPRGLNEP